MNKISSLITNPAKYFSYKDPSIPNPCPGPYNPNPKPDDKIPNPSPKPDIPDSFRKKHIPLIKPQSE